MLSYQVAACVYLSKNKQFMNYQLFSSTKTATRKGQHYSVLAPHGASGSAYRFSIEKVNTHPTSTTQNKKNPLFWLPKETKKTTKRIHFHKSGFKFFSLPLQAAFQLSFTVLIFYRSTCNIQTSSENKPALRMILNIRDSYQGIQFCLQVWINRTVTFFGASFQKTCQTLPQLKPRESSSLVLRENKNHLGLCHLLSPILAASLLISVPGINKMLQSVPWSGFTSVIVFWL